MFNSLIEAHNKVIKYNYLYKMTIADEGELRRAIDWIAEISTIGLTFL